MFRQLDIDEEIPLLEKLEQATKNDLPENQISSLTQEVIDKTILLLKEDFKISDQAPFQGSLISLKDRLLLLVVSASRKNHQIHYK